MTQDMETVLATVQVPDQDAMIALFGSFDENMQLLETECGVKVRVSDREWKARTATCRSPSPCWKRCWK